MHFNLNTAVQPITRRSLLGAAVVAGPALAQTPAPPTCHIGPPPHDKGPRVRLDMDQVELDAAYNQIYYAPLQAPSVGSRASVSWCARGLGCRGAKQKATFAAWDDPTWPEGAGPHRAWRSQRPRAAHLRAGNTDA